MGGVLAIFAHPDDESLLAGGTLAACAAARVPARVVSLTRGEAGGIGAVRERELQQAAGELGLTGAECLGYPDAQLDTMDWAQIALEVAARIRRWRPSVVITFGPEGLYWHPDHVAVHHVTWAAVETAPVNWVYEATWPQGAIVRLVEAMADRGLPTDLWGLDPALFGASPERITATLDVRPFLGRKLRALHSHRSQIRPDHLLAALPDDLAREYLGDEHFTRVRGGNGRPR